MPSKTQQTAADNSRQFTPDYLNWDRLPDDVLTDGKTARQVLRISKTHLWRLEKSGTLVGYKFGASKRYRVGNIRDALRGSEVQS